MEQDSAEFAEYKRLILSELSRLQQDITSLNGKINDLLIRDFAQVKTDIALLKFQAWLGGSIAGSIFAGLITLVAKFIK